MDNLSYGKEQITVLSALKGDHRRACRAKKITLLEQLAALPLKHAGLIKEYHDCLLFLCSQPDNYRVWQLAMEGLEKISGAVENIYRTNSPAKQASLNSTGIYGTSITCSFSYDIACWLYHLPGSNVSLHSCGAGSEQVSKILELCLPGMEYEEVTQGKYGLAQRIRKLSGKKNTGAALGWLLETIEGGSADHRVKNFLYEQLQVYVQWKLEEKLYSRTFLRSLPEKIFYPDENTGIITDHRAYIRKKINPPVKLSPAMQISLLNVARASLALEHRETDPVSFADAKAVRYFNMGNGISIALYSMRASKRFTLESYIGYMAFLNTVPVAYGGGWIFGERCKIGISIYPPYRGANSVLLFSAVLRLYYGYLGARRFLVKPYQFGKNNPDGLRSGAFWFYYKLGFVPVDESLSRIAADEYVKKTSIKKYRSSLAMLKQFTASPVELVLRKGACPSFDTGILSRSITQYIIRSFTGNREMAEKYCAQQLKKMGDHVFTKKMSATQSKILEKQSLWFALLFDGNEKAVGWTLKEQQQLIRLLLSKYGDNEMAYVKQLQQSKKIRDELIRLYEPR